MPRPRSRPRAHVLALAVPLASLLAATVLVVPDAAAEPAGPSELQRLVSTTDRTTSDPTSYATVIGDDDSYAGGVQDLYRAADGIGIGGSPATGVLVRLGDQEPQAEHVDLVVAAPQGEVLAPGRYTGAVDYPVQGARPGISLTVDHTVCTTGSFTVHDLAPDLSHLWISYQVVCEGAAVRGEVRADLPTSDPLVVAARAVTWPARSPGRAYTAQPVFAFNSGTTPVTLGAPAASGAGFTVEATTCGVLVPGASCAVTVGFEPTSRDVVGGELVVPRPGAAAVVVPLVGVGNGGESQWAVRRTQRSGRTDDSFSTAADRVLDVAASRSSISMNLRDPARDAPHDVDGSVFVRAPAGQRLVQGRTYATTADQLTRGAVLDIFPGCSDLEAPGRFVLDELTYRADGSLAGFRMLAEQTCATGEVVRSVLAWQADDAAPAFAPFARVRTALDFSRSATTAQVGVVVPLGHGIDAIDLYAVTRDGRRRLVTTAAPDDRGRVSVSEQVAQRTRYVAVARAGATTLATGAADVDALRIATLVAERGVPDRTAVYRAGERARLLLFLAPSTRGDCLRVEVQRHVERRWVARSTSACRRTDDRGSAVARLAGRGGQLLRARVVWPGDRASDPAVSGWQQVRFRRR